MNSDKEKLERILKVGLEISNVKDLDILLERILTEARALANADAGSIYIKDGDQLKFSYTQNETQRSLLGPGKKLPYSTFSIPINNRSIAGYVAFTGEILNIPDVYNVTGGVPYAFDAKYDQLTHYRTGSLLTVPLSDNRGEVIGVLQIINAQSDDGKIVPFKDEDVPLFVHFACNAAIALERAKMTRTTILRMIKMAEMRDPYETGPHANRVASYAQEIFETWAFKKAMPQKEIDTLKDILKVAAILHYVGKIAVYDTILKKPGKLNDDEFETMKGHTYIGARLFVDGNSELDQAAASVALNHHEKWDGSGYPGHVDPISGAPIMANGKGRGGGKIGNEIPVFGRIVAIADVYDALCSPRSYKKAWGQEQVLEEMNKQSGRHFDPEMMDAFMDTLDEIGEVAKRYPYEVAS